MCPTLLKPAPPAASMKALPKRKGNCNLLLQPALQTVRLNESPSQKEGKSVFIRYECYVSSASMKALPKRKGNGDQEH